eukprot:9493055-Alexandrium_andersonii.AAC.1
MSNVYSRKTLQNLGVDERNLRLDPDAKDDVDHETESYDEESATQSMMALVGVREDPAEHVHGGTLEEDLGEL